MEREVSLFRVAKVVEKELGQGPVSLSTWNEDEFNILSLFREASPDQNASCPCARVHVCVCLCARVCVRVGASAFWFPVCLAADSFFSEPTCPILTPSRVT